VALGVGDSTEALELRHAGLGAPILILGALVPSEIPLVVASGITPVVHSTGRLQDLEEEARRQDRILPVHLKVDTGMGRLGMHPKVVPQAARAVVRSAHLRFEGLMSHLSGNAGDPGNRAQVRCFDLLMQELATVNLVPPQVHLRATSGVLDTALHSKSETLTRAGAALYGFSPDGERLPEGLQPVLTLRSQIVFLKDVEPGAPVGYGGRFRASRPTRLAVIPLGYDDGMPLGLGNGGEVLVHGRRAPIAGAVSMDYTTLDITDVPGARVGDTVTVIGADGASERITVEEVARRAGTIPYAVLCGLGRRVVRIPTSEQVLAS
jgi:alanine racemase